MQKKLKIVTLVENTCGNEACIAEHGLSLYIETEKHRILADAGQTDAVVRNAEQLGIDLSEVDTVVLSHGHYDHSGGLIPFSKINSRARIFMQRTAAEPHYNGDRYIGIDPSLIILPGMTLIDGDMKIDEELSVFSGVTGRRLFPKENSKLSVLRNGEKIPDDFIHEQFLVITNGCEKWLISGCAHNGILNILDRYRELYGSFPDYVITGFHMMKKTGEYDDDEKAAIVKTAEELSGTDTVFYSGHCTGIPAFEIMKEIMGDRLIALHSGVQVI